MAGKVDLLMGTYIFKKFQDNKTGCIFFWIQRKSATIACDGGNGNRRTGECFIGKRQNYFITRLGNGKSENIKAAGNIAAACEVKP